MPPSHPDSPPTTNLSDLVLSANDNLLADSSVAFPSPTSSSRRSNDGQLDADDDDTFLFDQASASKSTLTSSSLGGTQDNTTGGVSQGGVGVVFGGSMGVFESDPMKATTSGRLEETGLPGSSSSTTTATMASRQPKTSYEAAAERQRQRQRGQTNEDGIPLDLDGEDDQQASDMDLSDQAMQAMGLTEAEIKRVHQLRAERDGLRDMNGMLGDMVNSIKGVETKLKTFSNNATTTHELLDLYSRLSSQAEHTQNLLLDPEFRGASADAAVREARQAEALRIQQEEEERVQRVAREREEARLMREQQLAEGVLGQGGVVRGSTRGGPRGTSTRGLRGVRSVSSGLSGRNTSSSVNASTISTTSSMGAAVSGAGRGRPGATGTVTGVRGVRGLRSRVGVVGGRGASAGRGGSGSSMS
ncbi:BZ3500_MvSof-1268-A1-R1_Chr12-1g03660 [Microbotryum saponariae]|uniref:DASH complex subunit DUO1 n=1 Tax=Microbotryum saponariae TaxID=289078 RepID=A0A2X0MKL5_9BASI|nr:BZ3500_MvSof-1268-A1-R1_Chr12-1g03660 [Microbotryum saponariae]SDA05253.1 BZ3501_MvSof-1269-A2-R1_Chr12-1g03237 [Microbotryum saponariae]